MPDTTACAARLQITKHFIAMAGADPGKLLSVGNPRYLHALIATARTFIAIKYSSEAFCSGFRAFLRHRPSRLVPERRLIEPL